MFTVNRLSRFIQDPKKYHVQATQRLLKYLHMTPKKGILFKTSKDITIKGYANADWARDVNDRKLTSEYCCFI